MSELSNFHSVLRESRVRAKLTQKELADLAGLSIRAIRDLERGRVGRPRKDTIRLLADALRLTGGRRASFEASAASPSANDALHTEIQTLAELLVSERRRVMASDRTVLPSGRDIVIIATRRDGARPDWAVTSMLLSSSA